MRFGMIGLGRMGAGLARRAMRSGHECVGYDPNEAFARALAEDGAIAASSLKALIEALPSPRIVWVMVPIGVTASVVEEVAALLSPGDILIDGGNSNFRHSIGHAERLAESGIRFLDVGTSGGVFGLERGFCLMIGGDREAFETAEPLFRALAPGVETAARTSGRNGEPASAEQGYLHCGPAGAGHFAKMVHNGIEYGMMASFAEGLNLLATAKTGEPPYDRFDFDLAALTEVWRRGSVVSSWLLDLTATALHDDESLAGYTGHVSDSGEGRWTAQAAIDLGVPAHTLTAALFDRFASRGNAEVANKLLSAMRKQFGGHVEPKG